MDGRHSAERRDGHDCYVVFIIIVIVIKNQSNMKTIQTASYPFIDRWAWPKLDKAQALNWLVRLGHF